MPKKALLALALLYFWRTPLRDTLVAEIARRIRSRSDTPAGALSMR